MNKWFMFGIVFFIIFGLSFFISEGLNKIKMWDGSAYFFNSVKQTKRAVVSMQKGAKTTLPDNFPNDIPIYPKAKIATLIMDKGKIFVSLESDETIKALDIFYGSEIPKQGWKLTANGPQIYSATKKERELDIIIAKNKKSQKNTITINAGSN